jgi:hypothetical protein
MDAQVTRDARAEACAAQLETLDMSDPARFQQDTIWPCFERLRREAPVHYCPDSPYGPYWSVTKYRNIVLAEVAHQVFSSDSRSAASRSRDQPKHLNRPSFIRIVGGNDTTRNSISGGLCIAQ